MRVAIFLDGEPPAMDKIEKIEADLVICVDGAINYLKNYTTMIDIVLGDFDSFIQPSPIFDDFVKNGTEIIRYSADKNETDSELALLEAARRGAEYVDIYGAMGKRDDHALANLGLLARANSLGIKARIITAHNIIYLANGDFAGTARVGQYISLVPFGGCTHILKSEGLKYPLKDDVLTCDSTRGISNIATDETFRITIKSGVLLIFLVA